MIRVAPALLPLFLLVTVAGCGKNIDHVMFEKVGNIVTPSMNTNTPLDWAKVEELLGGPGSHIEPKEYTKLTKKEPYKDAKIKIWRGKRGTYICIEYDPKTNAAKGFQGNVPQR